MSTIDLVEHLLKILNEIIFPALALWVAYLVRKWLTGQLETPPYEHKVSLQPPPVQPAAVGASVPHAPSSPIDHHAHR